MNEDKGIKWVLVVLLIAFVLGSLGMLLYQKNRYKDIYFEYNSFVVHKGKDKAGNIVYQTKIFVGDGVQPYLITTRFSPKDLESIPVHETLKEDLLKKEIYITLEPEPVSTAITVLAATEISKITGNIYLYNIPTHPTLTSPVEGKNIEIKTCNDVNENQAIVYLKQSDQSRIYSKEGCVIIEGKDEYDLIKVANRLIFTLLGIMEV